MFSFNDKISLRQIQALIILEIFGFGIISLPRQVYQIASKDGWISVVLGCVFVLFIAFILLKLSKHFKPNIIVAFILAIRLGYIGAFHLNIFGDIIKEFMLPNTPVFIVAAAMLFICAYASSKGLETRARLAEILLPIAFLPLIIIFSLSLRDVDFANLTPILSQPVENILQGSLKTIMAFSGIEVLILVYPYINKPQKLVKSWLAAIVILCLSIIAITVLTIARFGEGIVYYRFPIIMMMDTTSLQGSILERQGALIITFWIISAFANISSMLFFSSLVLRDALKKGTHSIYIIIMAVLIFVGRWFV